MIKRLIFFVGFGVLTACGVPPVAQGEIEVIDVAARCQQGENYQCFGACTDGWEVLCYYDATRQTIKGNYALADQKDKCFAFYEKSVCTPCRHIYSIESKKVSCEEFYNAINAKNRQCDGCLTYEMKAGG